MLPDPDRPDGEDAGCGCGQQCWCWQRSETWLWSPLLNDPQRMGDAYRWGTIPLFAGVTSDTETARAWRYPHRS